MVMIAQLCEYTKTMNCILQNGEFCGFNKKQFLISNVRTRKMTLWLVLSPRHYGLVKTPSHGSVALVWPCWGRWAWWEWTVVKPCPTTLLWLLSEPIWLTRFDRLIFSLILPWYKLYYLNKMTSIFTSQGTSQNKHLPWTVLHYPLPCPNLSYERASYITLEK